MIFLVFAICGCSKEDEFVISGLVLSHESLEMVRGEIVTLETVILPQSSAEERIAWYTSDGAVATVDKDGNVKARALGNAVIYAICHDMTAECNISVVQAPQPNVGDWYYSDGTYSSEMKKDKVCIGVVFHVGHHENDLSDYSGTGIGAPECHGYAVAVADANQELCSWGEYGHAVGTYPVSDTGDNVDNFTDNGGDIDWSGFAYTEKLKNFSGASYSGYESISLTYPALYHVMDYEENVQPSPEYSSGWFMPSISQLYEMISVTARLDNPAFTPYQRQSWYWSSSELYMMPESSVICVSTGNWLAGYRGKYEEIASVRPVLAF